MYYGHYMGKLISMPPSCAFPLDETQCSLSTPSGRLLTCGTNKSGHRFSSGNHYVYLWETTQLIALLVPHDAARHQPPNSTPMPPKPQGGVPDPGGSRTTSSSNTPCPGNAALPPPSSPDPLATAASSSTREYYSTPVPSVPARVRSTTASRTASHTASPICQATAQPESFPAPETPAQDNKSMSDNSSNAPTHLELTNTTDTVELDFQAITAMLNSTTAWLNSHRDFDSDSTDSTQVFTQKLYNFMDMAIGAGFGSTPTWENETLQQVTELAIVQQAPAPTPPPPPAAPAPQPAAQDETPKGKGKAGAPPPPQQTPKVNTACYRKPPPPPNPVKQPCSYANAARTAPTAAMTPKAAAPTPAASAAPRKRGKKATPTYNRTGPSHCSIMVTFQTAAPAASFSILVASRSSLVIDSACVAFAGWVLSASGIPTEPKLTVVRQVIHSVCTNHSDPKPWVGLPASTSYLRIMGAPYWSNGTGTVRLTPTDFEAKLLAALFKELVQLSGPPRIVRDSRTSWSCTVYFNIHNSQTSACASQLIKRELMFRNAVCPIQGTRATAGTPHCMRCHCWGHPTTACIATKTICAHCAGPHNEANHCEAAACCQAKPKANPPVPAALAGVDCPHAPHCVNCGGDHLATAWKCVFFRNRFDREWINARYAQDFDILFIQEPPWRLIRTVPSAVSVEGEEVVGAPNHPQWLAMVCPPEPDTPPCVIAYISMRLSAWRPSMCRDIIDHHNVLVLSLFADGHTFNLMNVYSDSEFTAIRLLSDHADTLPLFQYMGGDFNCHSSVWDPVPRAPNVAASHWLLQAAAEIGLELATVANPGPTHIPRDVTKRPLVIDLVFLPVALSAAVSTKRVINDQSDLDHIPLLTSIPILPVVQTATRQCLPSDPEKAQAFLDDLVTKLRLIVLDDVEAAAKVLADTFSAAWLAHSRDSNVMRCSNPWWNETCSTALQQHHALRNAGDWAQFRQTIKQAKRAFFDTQIAKIAVKSKHPWDLMNWVQQHKLPLCEAIQDQGKPCHDTSVLWDALHGTYNAASGCACDMTVLDPLPAAPARKWLPFSQFELTDALSSCSNCSAPGPDHIKWTHLKYLVKDTHCMRVLLSLANACLRVGHWPATLKESLSVIIPKPGKPSYSAPKAFRPIALLNMLGKLIKKMLANRMQFNAVGLNIFHQP
ncbi:hypothetical protein D9619_010442 [Psilocybe cf. subviscida]|uniref:Endonuclease/exonuclease/phosphatase domain-containing protein n=1 Tax=Psilocybe cf. subviscida TaxID=2480587 RepID=A0A8H5ES01_9AGAR|nr:hypothetical protein D9619_010442 [Psilocybe cf. subviscida]